MSEYGKISYKAGKNLVFNLLKNLIEFAIYKNCIFKYRQVFQMRQIHQMGSLNVLIYSIAV